MKLKTFCLILLSSLFLLVFNAYAAHEEEKEALVSKAGEAATATAISEFAAAVKKVANENGFSAEDTATQKASVEDYYRKQYGEEYKKKNSGKTAPKLDQYIKGLTPIQTTMQYFYMSNNSHPLGSKHLLEKANDKSTYSTLHAKYHPAFVEMLDDLGLYDIFLTDSDGLIVYSVYKEVDYMGNHVSGPNADTGLGKAIQLALKAKAGEIVDSGVDAYPPSYDASARFYGTKVGNGTMVIQVNP